MEVYRPADPSYSPITSVFDFGIQGVHGTLAISRKFCLSLKKFLVKGSCLLWLTYKEVLKTEGEVVAKEAFGEDGEGMDVLYLYRRRTYRPDDSSSQTISSTI